MSESLNSFHSDPTDRCPSEERIERFLSADLPDAERDELTAHLDDCTTCRDLVAALVVGERSSGRPLSVPGEPISGGQVGSYALTGVLGVGGMGVVYAARDLELNRMVALKILRARAEQNDELERRLIRESRAMARLAHPNVVTVYHVGRWRDRLYLAMEYVDGVTVRDWLAQGRRDPAAVIDVFRQAGEGLRAAHAAGLVHRDFKPDNILIDRAGRVRVSDFGLAGSPEPTVPSSDLALSHRLAGTPGYMAPELFAGAAADHRSDLFSFSVALYEALWSIHPFARRPGESVDQALRRPAARPPRRRDVPVRVVRAVLTGLELDPARRPTSIAVMLSSLAPARPRVTRWMVGSIVMAGLAIAIGVWPRDSERSACADAGAPVTDQWNPVRKAILAAPFLRAGVQYTAADWKRIESGLDEASAKLAAESIAACRATRAGKQPRETLERRTECVAGRLDRFTVMLDLLSTGDVEISTTLANGAERLAHDSSCESAKSMDGRVLLSSDPDIRRKGNDIRRRMARLEEGFYSGGRRDILPEVEAIALEAEHLGDLPILADVLYELGEVQSWASTPDAAEATWRRAALTAEAGRADRIAALAWIKLIHHAAGLGSEPAKGDEYAEHALAALTRLGHPDDLEAWYENQMGWLRYTVDRDTGAALAHERRALALWDATGDVSKVGPLNAIGVMLDDQGNNKEALATYRRILREEEARYGADHPYLSTYHINLAAALLLDSPWEAQHHAEKGRALMEQLVAVDHPNLAAALITESLAFARSRRYEQALAPCERALATYRQVYGNDYLYTAHAMMMRAGLLFALGQQEEALGEGARAVDIVARLTEPNSQNTALLRLAMAMLDYHAGRVDQAASGAQRAIDVLGPIDGRRDDVACGMAMVGAARRQRGDLRGAIEILEQALALHQETAHEPGPDRAMIEFELARALFAARGDRARAIQLAQAARLRLVGWEQDRMNGGGVWPEIDRFLIRARATEPASRPSRSR